MPELRITAKNSNIQNVLLEYVAHLFLSILFFSICSVSYSQKLNRYTCDVDRVSITGFEQMRSFDDEGIIISGSKYHPLAIAQYGLLCYYEFEKTQDSSYYYKCLNQAKYFFDTSRVNIMFDGKGIGLPYNYNFWDLKAPWYSGMTQGYSISFMLRYYKLTDDEKSLDLIKKLAYVLLQPQELGGAISKTKEGYTWIEEYPNSKTSPQVLNGYINALIGLKEYTDFFPEDKHAKQILEETYVGLVNTLEHFDTPTWSHYNLNKRVISNKYLRYQVYEMTHLYEIFNDDIFEYQKRIWSTFVYNKFIKDPSKHHLYRDHNMSIPVEELFPNIHGVPMPNNLLVASTDRMETVSYEKSKSEGKFLCRRKERLSVTFSDKSLEREQVNMLWIDFQSSEALTFEVESLKTGKLLELQEYTVPNGRMLLFTDDVEASQIKIWVEGKGRKLELDSLNVDLYDTKRWKAPFYGHFTSENTVLKGGENYLIDLEEFNTKDVVIFYKNAETADKLNLAKWKAKNTIDKEFKPRESGVYQFLIVFDYLNSASMIGKFCINEKK